MSKGSETCLKIYIVIVNVFMFLIGLTLLGVGAVLMNGSNTLAPLLGQALEAGAGSSENGTSNAALEEKVEEVASIFELFHSLALVLVLVGLFVAIVSVLGMTGPCFMNSCVLDSYTIIIVLVLAAHLAIFLVLLNGVFAAGIRATVLSTLTTKYEGTNGTSTYSLLWNYVMINYECCGVDNYTDFHEADKWSRNQTFEGEDIILVTPVACCKMEGEFPDITPLQANCSYEPSDANSNYKKSCWDAVHEREVNPHLLTIKVVTCVVLLFEISVIVCQALLIGIKRKSETEPTASQLDLAQQDGDKSGADPGLDD